MSRITSNSMINSYLQNLANQRKNQAGTIEQISTQKRVNRPSDDPVAIAKILDINKRYGINSQFIRNIDNTQHFLSESENKLSEYVIHLEKVLTRAMAGLSDTSFDSLGLVADEIDGIRNEIYRITNAQVGDDFIFSGTETDTPPFADNIGTGGFMGNNETINIEIDTNYRVPKNTISLNVFYSNDNNVLQDLEELSNAFRTQDRDTALQVVDRVRQYMDNANTKLGNIGINTNNLQNTRRSLENNSVDLRNQLQTIEDIDLAETIIKLSQSELGLNSTLAIGDKIIGRSLIDFLG